MGGQAKLFRQMKERVLTEFICMFRAEGVHNSVCERRNPLQFRLIDKLRNITLALAFSP